MSSMTQTAPGGRLQVMGPMAPRYDEILTAEALAFIEQLSDRFAGQIDELLRARGERQKALDAGILPDFLPNTRDVREAEWRIEGIPEDLQDRRVEITGPVDRKMVINALNSGAKVYMADFEDSTTPTWANIVDGQINLRDAVRREIDFTSPEGKAYRLGDDLAVLMVRPRGLHLPERHVRLDERPVPGALVDFGLYLFHNATALLERGTGPYFYIPKLESHLEARLWNQIIDFAEDHLGLARGTVKVTLLIETLPAVFEMDEILFELRQHIVGLNCGRWDYIFSYIKRFRAHAERVLPDRAQVTMTVPFLRAYSQLLIQTCHRRGAFAMGGMAAQIPVKNDPEANEAALAKVRADKEREVGDGHDGTWVAHPGLVPIAREIFDAGMSGPNQLQRMREDVAVTADELIAVPEGTITETGMRGNIAVAVQYLAAWLAGQGCVPINHLMEDAATAEIARAQLWQWIRYRKGKLDDGRDIDQGLFERMLDEELDKLRQVRGDAAFDAGHFRAAAELLRDVTADDDFAEFITLPAYERLAS